MIKTSRSKSNSNESILSLHSLLLFLVFKYQVYIRAFSFQAWAVFPHLLFLLPFLKGIIEDISPL